MRLQNLLPHELRRAVREGWPAFVAFGALEYHAEHLPLGTDTLIAEGILAELERRADIVVAPAIPVAPTLHWAGGPADGDLDFSGEALLGYVREYLARLLDCGFSRIYVLLGHQGIDGDPGTLVRRAAWDLTERAARSFGEGWGRHPERIPGAEEIFSRIVPALYDQYCEYPAPGRDERLPVGHAGRGETQLIQALCPGLAEPARLETMERPWPEWLSDVGRANPEDGRFWVDFCVDGWVRHLHETK